MTGTITTVAEFSAFVKKVESQSGYRRPLAFGIGVATVSAAGKILDTYFPFPNHSANYGTAAVLAKVVGHVAGTQSYAVRNNRRDEILGHFDPFKGDGKRHGNIDTINAVFKVAVTYKPQCGYRKCVVVSFVDQPGHDQGPQTVSDAYLRLHLLSLRLVKPNEINLTGIFGILPNNAWTNEGPIAPEDLPERRLRSMMGPNPLHVYSVDKFPCMVDYVVEPGIRIGDGARVRLGAYLGEGTTVMHEGFCNFNAGMLGTSMVEGRVSAGVVVGDQTDIGGGASIMGTLSGGGKEKITIGRGCLIGANGGTGIPLGNLCVIEAGLYVTAGMLVVYNGTVVKAAELSGMSGLTFRRNSTTGQVEALDKPNAVTLNVDLHKN